MRHYDLPIIRGASVSLINSERGVELGRAADGREALAFAERDGTREVPLAEIESVRLMLGGSFFRPIPQLRMQFKAGDKLTVSGGPAPDCPRRRRGKPTRASCTICARRSPARGRSPR